MFLRLRLRLRLRPGAVISESSVFTRDSSTRRPRCSPESGTEGDREHGSALARPEKWSLFEGRSIIETYASRRKEAVFCYQKS
jgi:hypothetical protein